MYQFIMHIIENNTHKYFLELKMIKRLTYHIICNNLVATNGIKKKNNRKLIISYKI